MVSLKALSSLTITDLPPSLPARAKSPALAERTQEDPFQSMSSPEDLEEMGDQPPPPNTARTWARERHVRGVRLRDSCY